MSVSCDPGRFGGWSGTVYNTENSFCSNDEKNMAPAGNASKDVNERLMTAIKNSQRDQVQLILQREGMSLSDRDLTAAWRRAVYFRNEDILFTLIKYGCHLVFKETFHLRVRKDHLGSELDQDEIVWLFDTLSGLGIKELALVVAATHPEKTLLDKMIWPEVIPALDRWISYYFKYVASVMSHLHAQIDDSCLTSLKQWCVENCYVNMVFYLAMVTKDWELVETMMITQLSLDVDPVLLYRFIESVLDDTRTGRARGCSAAVAALKRYPLNYRTVRVFAGFPNGEPVAKACEDEGLSDWGLLFSSPSTLTFKQLCENGRNQCVLIHVLREAVRKNKWNIVSELVPRCSDNGTLELVLRHAFWEGRIYVAKETMLRMDPSTINVGSSTLICEAINSRIFHCEDTARHLVRLCISSGLSTVQRFLSRRRDIYYIISGSLILKFRLMKLLVASGTFTHATLLQLSSALQSVMTRQASEEEKKCLGYVQEAAATPCSLQHLARLAVSHIIGCKPGRPERIQALPLRDDLKSYLRFSDVLTADTQFSHKADDREK